MLRRQARLRREYLYRKSMEHQEKATLDRKRKLSQAMEEGRRIPTELRNEEVELRKSMKFDDEERSEVTTHQDDEYSWAGVEDPKVVITTSHNPSSRLKQFSKELRLIFPNAQRINRGNYVMSQLVQACRSNDITDLIIVHEHRGEPDTLVIGHLPYGPTATFNISNTVMRHDIPDVGTMSEAFPHLIFHNMKTKLGERVTNILKYLFPVPKADSKRVVTFANQEDYISFRHHVYKLSNGGKDVELKEVGPRFELKYKKGQQRLVDTWTSVRVQSKSEELLLNCIFMLEACVFEIKLGTVDQVDVDVEWRLRPYLNTAKKRLALSDEATNTNSTAVRRAAITAANTPRTAIGVPYF